MKPEDIQIKKAIGYRQYAQAAALISAVAVKWRNIQASQKTGKADDLPDLMDAFVDMQFRIVRLYLVDESCMTTIEAMSQTDFFAIYERVMEAHTGESGVSESDPLPGTSTKSVEDTPPETPSS